MWFGTSQKFGQQWSLGPKEETPADWVGVGPKLPKEDFAIPKSRKWGRGPRSRNQVQIKFNGLKIQALLRPRVSQALDEHCLRKKKPKEPRTPCVHQFPELTQRPETLGAKKIQKNRRNIRKIPRKDLQRPKVQRLAFKIFCANQKFQNPGQQPRREAPSMPQLRPTQKSVRS